MRLDRFVRDIGVSVRVAERILAPLAPIVDSFLRDGEHPGVEFRIANEDRYDLSQRGYPYIPRNKAHRVKNNPNMEARDLH